MRFDLTDLRLFVSVAEQGSLTRGAQAVNLSLASASERISGMEALLGAELLDRTPRGVKPTAAGEALGRHARLILFQVEQMRGELRSYGRGLKGRVRLLSNTAALIGFLPARLCRFLVDHPDLSVDVAERPSIEIARSVAEGLADLGIATDIADLQALQTRPLTEDRLFALVSAQHRLADQPNVAFADLAGDPFVGVMDAALETHLAERASRLGVQLAYRTRIGRMRDVAMLVAAGVGVAIASEASVADLGREGLAVIPLSDTWAHRRLHLCARDFRALAPPAAILAQYLDHARP